MTATKLAHLVAAAALISSACHDANDQPKPRPGGTVAPAATSAATSATPKAANRTRPAAARASTQSASKRKPATQAKSLELFVGGDVSFGRMRGERLLRQPLRNDFAPLSRWLNKADLRFINLECPLSDHPLQGPMKMVFSGPPSGAAALKRAGIDLVSLANNHAWDYGKDGLFQTMANLDKERIRYVGARRKPGSPYRAVLIRKHGIKLAFLAVTAIWNQSFSPHPGKAHIADAKLQPLVKEIARIRKRVDFIILSHHGGYEYVDEPHPATIRLLRGAIRAGVDVVVGHHPHVVQRVALIGNKPLFYSLGNLLMRMTSKQPWTEFGIAARIKLRPNGRISSRLCPYRIHGLEALPLGQDPRRKLYETHFGFKLRQLMRAGALVEKDAPTRIGPFGADGCAAVLAGQP